MTAEDFYEAFKEALRYVGLQWGDKQQALVWVDDGRIHVSYCDNEASFKVGGTT